MKKSLKKWVKYVLLLPFFIQLINIPWTLDQQISGRLLILGIIIMIVAIVSLFGKSQFKYYKSSGIIAALLVAWLVWSAFSLSHTQVLADGLFPLGKFILLTSFAFLIWIHFKDSSQFIKFFTRSISIVSLIIFIIIITQIS